MPVPEALLEGAAKGVIVACSRGLAARGLSHGTDEKGRGRNMSVKHPHIHVKLSFSILLLTFTAACIGGRVGYRHDYNAGEKSGVYAGATAQFSSQTYPFTGGAELAFTNVFGSGRFVTLMPGAAFYNVADSNNGEIVGVGASIGLELGESWGVQASLCGLGGYYWVYTTLCGRWSSNQWFGADIGASSLIPAALAIPALRDHYLPD